MGEKKKNHHETSVHYWLVFSCTRTYREAGAQTIKLTFKKQFLLLMALSVPHQSLSHILNGGKTKHKENKKNFCVMLSDPRGGEAADEGDTAEAHPPEEGGADRLHDEVLQKNSQLCEQGAAVWVSSGCVAESEESIVNERQQQASLATEEHENSGWHQEDLVAGDELENVLLIGCKFVQEVSDEH